MKGLSHAAHVSSLLTMQAQVEDMCEKLRDHLGDDLSPDLATLLATARILHGGIGVAIERRVNS